MTTKVRQKHAPVGLFGRGHLPPTDKAAAYSGQWIQVGWKDIELAPGHYDFTVLDALVARMVNVNPAWVARLRIFAGYRAPDYLLAETGTYPCTDSTVSGVWHVMNWWKPVAAQRYDAFLAALAAHIESNPSIIEVSCNLTGSVFAEPLIRQIADPTTKKAMLAAGYTWDADQIAVNAGFTSCFNHLRATRVGFNFNPWQNAEAGKQDIDATLALMAQWRTTMARHLVLENASLDASPGGLYAEMYADMKTLGRPIGFQTRAPARLPDPAGAFKAGLGYGATSFEPNDSDFKTLAEAQAVADACKANQATAIR